MHKLLIITVAYHTILSQGYDAHAYISSHKLYCLLQLCHNCSYMFLSHIIIHTDIQTCIHAYMHASTRAYMHTYMHTCIHAYTHTHK